MGGLFLLRGRKGGAFSRKHPVAKTKWVKIANKIKKNTFNVLKMAFSEPKKLILLEKAALLW